MNNCAKFVRQDIEKETKILNRKIIMDYMRIKGLQELSDLQEIEFDDEDDIANNNLQGPFDPNDIDVDISVVNLGSLLEQLEFEEIDLKPEFQRSSDVWTNVEKSRLIESVLLGLPLPSFYFSEDPVTNKLVIVDGLQRLCAFKDFWIEKKLVLAGMQFLTELNGKAVEDLDRTQIRRIKSLKVTLNTLRKGTPPEVKFVIFQRVNTAGVPLTPQEMRNALYQKKATDLLRRMAKLESFKQATGNRVSPKRMTDCDFVNRFVAFFLMKDQYDSDLDSFMGKALEHINKMEPIEIENLYQTFDKSMKVCYQLLGDKAFRRPNPDKKGKYLKTNKAIFEVLSVSIAKLTPYEQTCLISNKELFADRIRSLFTDNDFIKSVTSGTAKLPQVEYRFKQIKEQINFVLGYDKENRA